MMATTVARHGMTHNVRGREDHAGWDCFPRVCRVRWIVEPDPEPRKQGVGDSLSSPGTPNQHTSSCKSTQAGMLTCEVPEGWGRGGTVRSTAAVVSLSLSGVHVAHHGLSSNMMARITSGCVPFHWRDALGVQTAVAICIGTRAGELPPGPRFELRMDCTEGQHRGPALRCVRVCTHKTFTKGESIFSRSTENGPACPRSGRVQPRPQEKCQPSHRSAFSTVPLAGSPIRNSGLRSSSHDKSH